MQDVQKRMVEAITREVEHRHIAAPSLRRGLTLLVLCVSAVHAADYQVAPDGSGKFTTVQACADAAQPGDRCLVSPGVYTGRVSIKRGGTGDSDSQRIIFKATGGGAIVEGFNLQSPYVTVDGFEVKNAVNAFELFAGADYCGIINNLIGPVTGKGVMWNSSANYTVVRGNRFRQVGYIYLHVYGKGHSIESNYMEGQNGSDLVDLWGTGSTFRRNVFWLGNGRSGNHPDWLQIFGDPVGSSDHLFEENMIFSLPNTQIAQLNAASPNVSPTPYPGFGHITWRRNIFVDVDANLNLGIPGMTWENNTFFRAPYGAAASGAPVTATLVRGAATELTIRNNVFLANGNTPNTASGTSGWYGFTGAGVSKEVIAFQITKSKNPQGATEVGILASLYANGYTDANGGVQAGARTLADVAAKDRNLALSQFVFDDAYSAYKDLTFDILLATVAMDTQVRATAYVGHNYVAGSPIAGYPAKRTSACSTGCGSYSRSQCFVTYNFCEDPATSINGGDPKVAAGDSLKSGVLAIPGPISGATWTAATQTLSKVGAFANYTTVLPTDQVAILTTTSPLVGGIYSVRAKLDNDTIVLGDLVRGEGLSADRTGVTISALTTPAFILGPDGIPFTLDDGLKPRQDSPLCGKGDGGTDIGAYSCNSGVVFSGSAGSGGGSPPPPTGDSIAPSTPTGLAASAASSSQIDLSWTASTDNVAVVGYKVYRNGSEVGSAATTKYSDTGLAAASAYTYTVSAYDAAGNISVASNPVSATTSSVSTPPPPPPPSGTGRTLTVKTDGSGNFTTIQACANAVAAGDTCVVYPGNYPEHVKVPVGGAVNQPITFRALNPATTAGSSTLLSSMRGFRLKGPYISIDGFDMTRYNVGLDPAFITLDPVAGNCSITNNVIRDGTYLTRSDYVFDAAAHTIYTPKGGFLAAGFEVGTTIYIGSNLNAQILNHDTVKNVIGVTDTTLTLAATDAMLSEGPVQSTIYVNRYDKAGVRAIEMTYSGALGTPDNCVISGNRISNLAGIGMMISGDNHQITQNRIERMNGWKLFNLEGSNNSIDHNVFLDSPRWPGFPPPDPGRIQGISTGGWDMIDSMIFSWRVTGINVLDNVFDSNFVLNLGNQFMTVSDSGTGPATSGFTISHNVFVGMERTGASQRPYTKVFNNTFYNSARGEGNVFVIGNGSAGTGSGSIVKNNVFLDNGKVDVSGALGWYSIAGASGYPAPTMGEPPNWNYVAGDPASGYLGKSGFAGMETAGINGGNPGFQGGSGFTAGILAVSPASGATWDPNAKTLTKAGAFARYTVAPTDTVRLISASPTNSTVVFSVASKLNNDTIVLKELPGGDTISGARTDIAFYPIPPVGLLLGPDGIPFTLDDGLKPVPGSLLCGKGDGGADIGAYSCDPTKVISTGVGIAPPATVTVSVR